ncbi:MAG: hypothetical protein M0Z80_14730, partial [Treponema sp.]|nr:hypothetical protein [Treponema sp.]
MSAWSSSLRARFKTFEFMVGSVLVGGIVLLVLASYFLYPDGGETIDLGKRLLKPFVDASHIFGTDSLGRDILARLVVGGRLT